MLANDLITKQPIVIDQGSSIFKGGFAGADRPKFSSHIFVLFLRLFIFIIQVSVPILLWWL